MLVIACISGHGKDLQRQKSVGWSQRDNRQGRRANFSLLGRSHARPSWNRRSRSLFAGGFRWMDSFRAEKVTE